MGNLPTDLEMATAYEERIAQCIRTAQELADGDFATDDPSRW